MSIDAEVMQLFREVDHAKGIEVAYNPSFGGGVPWTVRVYRDRPVHVTIGRGGTFVEALADVRRMVASYLAA